jgi:hypothetical protein
LIEVRPPPHEWFIPSQIAPWEKPSRDPQMALVLKKTEDPVVPNISIIVPISLANEIRRNVASDDMLTLLFASY